MERGVRAALQSSRRCASTAGRPVLRGIFKGTLEAQNLYPYPQFRDVKAAGPVAQARVFEAAGETAESLSGLASDYYHSCVCSALELAGSDAQKAEQLAQLNAGQRGAYCVAEEGAGTDASGIKCTAQPTEDGEHYVINGTKTWVVNGTNADHYLVFAAAAESASTKPSRLAAFLVPKQDGIHTTPTEKMGLDTCDIATVVFKEVRVPKTAMVGTLGSGYSLSLSVNSESQYRVAAGLVGMQKRLLSKVMAHANERTAFGRQLRDLPLVKQRVANMTMRIYAGEAALYKVADLLEAAGSTGREAQMESSQLKVFVLEEALKSVDDAVGVLGAAAYDNGWLSTLARDVAAFRTIGGTAEINTLLSALIGCEFGAAALKSKSTTAVMLARSKRSLGLHQKSTGVHASLAQSGATLDKLVVSFGSVMEQVVIKFGKKVTDQQMVVRRLSEASALLYSMGVVLSRASLSAEVGQDNAQHEAVLATTWCKHSADSVNALLADLSNVYKTTDTNMGRISDHVCLAGTYWPTHPCDVTKA